MTKSTDTNLINPEKSPPEKPPSNLFARFTGINTGWIRSLLLPTLALFVAMIFGAVFIALTDLEALALLKEDFGGGLRLMAEGVGLAYKALFTGAFGSVYGLSETLFAATPLLLTGLAVALGFRAGLFNIGANGQMLIGGMAALWVALHLNLPGYIHIPLAILAAIIGGALWAGISGLLKAITGAHEVITTIMLNFIAFFLVEYLLTVPMFQQAGKINPISEFVPPFCAVSTDLWS